MPHLLIAVGRDLEAIASVVSVDLTLLHREMLGGLDALELVRVADDLPSSRDGVGVRGVVVLNGVEKLGVSSQLACAHGSDSEGSRTALRHCMA